jgi:hypothetical protein
MDLGALATAVNFSGYTRKGVVLQEILSSKHIQVPVHPVVLKIMAAIIKQTVGIIVPMLHVMEHVHQ